jgi:hypothetical protein
MNFPNAPALRWDPYLMATGREFVNFWQKHLVQSEHRILYVLGRGFDPRMCVGLRSILAASTSARCDVVLLNFEEGADSPSTQYGNLVSRNVAELKSLVGDSQISTRHFQMWSGSGPGRHRIGPRNAAHVFNSFDEVEPYTHIVVDISALPRGIYFPLIGKLLYLLDHSRKSIPREHVANFHIVATEDAQLDSCIQDKGIDETAIYVHGFGADFEMEATADIPRLWMPILGEGQSTQLERIYTLVNPEEICPVLPFPSANPRRVDNLIVEYRELLERWHIEPTDIVYASEQNPFEAYRQICRTVLHYHQALAPLGGCKAVVSALSSKLLSIGALLAVYELKDKGWSVGLASVEAQGYEISLKSELESITSHGELFSLWLVGDCYE